MNQALFIHNNPGIELYQLASSLPIIDYHSHLSPQEIYLDAPFENISRLWLGSDHYKWRLMRQTGIEEELITGNASDEEKFAAYAYCVSLAAGNPLYHWSKMELSMFFDIDEPLCPENAREIFKKANECIKHKALSPSRIMQLCHVERAATTDDPTSSLEYHRLILQNNKSAAHIQPTFRTDRLMLIREPDFQSYIAQLEKASGTAINNLASFKKAIIYRLDAFCALNCRMSDIGIPYFPNSIASQAECERIFSSALLGRSISEEEFSAYLGHMYLFLAREYKERGIVMQLHLAVKRNANRLLYSLLGPDCGGDCINEPVPLENLLELFNAINDSCGMPKTILYTLNPAMYPTLLTAAGCFKNILPGPAWWFNDHLAGISQLLEMTAQYGQLALFPGMLTDSRSFLSYARHDYFRRILCNMLGDMCQKEELDFSAAKTLVIKLCYETSLALMQEVLQQ